MKIYAFMYNDCVHESAYGVVSLHRTPEGAESAMVKHKTECLEKYHENKLLIHEDYVNDTELSEEDRNFLIEHNQEDTFGVHQDWCVTEMELLD